MPPPARAHVFVTDLEATAPALTEDDRHHLARVLRLRRGEAVTLADGQGGWRPAVVTRADAGDGAVSLEPVGPVGHEPAPAPALTVAFSLTKGERPEWVVQKLTEVGIDAIVPVMAARSVVRWDPPKAVRNAERLRLVAREAAMQSRRLWLPTVADVVPFAAAAAELGATMALAHPGGGPPTLARPVVIVGPEGGWDEGELACGLPRVGLGPTVLRAETAAVAVGVLLAALRAGQVAPAHSVDPDW